VSSRILVELPKSNLMEAACRDCQIGSDVQAFRGSDARTDRRTACLPTCRTREFHELSKEWKSNKRTFNL